jgi:hypothetical protein
MCVTGIDVSVALGIMLRNKHLSVIHNTQIKKMKFTHVMKKKRIENEDSNPVQKLHLNTCQSL